MNMISLSKGDYFFGIYRITANDSLSCAKKRAGIPALLNYSGLRINLLILLFLVKYTSYLKLTNIKFFFIRILYSILILIFYPFGTEVVRV